MWPLRIEINPAVVFINLFSAGPIKVFILLAATVLSRQCRANQINAILPKHTCAICGAETEAS